MQTMSTLQPEGEFDVLGRLSHPNILMVHGCYGDASHVYKTCEYVPHPTWFDMLPGHGPREERLTITLMRQACDGVSYMHDMSVMHRDLKPENVLVNMEMFMLTIIDFGVSKYERATRTATTVCGSSIVGSGMYTAPEVYLLALRNADGFITRRHTCGAWV